MSCAGHIKTEKIRNAYTVLVVISKTKADLRRILDWISTKQELKVWAGFDWLNIRFSDSTHFAKIPFNIHYNNYYIRCHLSMKNCPSARCAPVVNMVYKAKTNLVGGGVFLFLSTKLPYQGWKFILCGRFVSNCMVLFYLYFVPLRLVHLCMCWKIPLIQDTQDWTHAQLLDILDYPKVPKLV